MSLEVSILTQPQQIVYGLWGESSDKTISKDISSLSKKYYRAVESVPQSVLPFFVISKDYDKNSGHFNLFIGGLVQHDQLDSISLPSGAYGKITIKPKLGFMWGLAVGEAKRYFYTQWLPASEYSALNMEYEFHTDKSIGKKPEIELLFALDKK